jgi:putative radical SAM enzyme (TIGR03279 family)
LTPEQPRGGRHAGLPVAAVEGAALRAGLREGDCLLRLNGVPPADVLDLELAAADGTIWMTVLRDGHPLDLVLEPRAGEWHGISLGHDGLGAPARRCRNACRFCFVDQLPPGLREAVYVKDDDYRLSFLHGNFTTLTNVDEADLDRIVQLRLQPLYVSLHAWDDAARVRLMGIAASTSRGRLEQLAAAGLELHLQVVLCPGWNDGDVLAETVVNAAALPAVADVGVVPVSLAHEGELRRVSAADARRLLADVAGWQQGFRRDRGVAFVHAADEFYLLAGELPPASDAGEQYENGIGMAAHLLEEAQALAAMRRPPAGGGGDAPRVGDALTGVRILSGVLARPVIARAAALLTPLLGVPVAPFVVDNRLFGGHVTVTGLLGGEEVLAALEERPLRPGEYLLAPRGFLPAQLGRTLDDVGEDRLAAACGGRLVLADSLTAAFGRLPR